MALEGMLVLGHAVDAAAELMLVPDQAVPLEGRGQRPHGPDGVRRVGHAQHAVVLCVSFW